MFHSKVQTQESEMDFSYLYSTKDRANLENYFKLKHKYDYVLSEEELEALKATVVKSFGHYDVVIHPQTSGLYLGELAKVLGDKVVCIAKNDKETIKELVQEQHMMKAERTSLMNCIDEMDGSFQINKVKGNQRKRFKNILFQETDLTEFADKKVLLLDDSVFSGATLIALKEFINIECDVKVLYSKF